MRESNALSSRPKDIYQFVSDDGQHDKVAGGKDDSYLTIPPKVDTYEPDHQYDHKLKGGSAIDTLREEKVHDRISFSRTEIDHRITRKR